jgi:geranylgeranyl diphosphate synthase type II
LKKIDFERNFRREREKINNTLKSILSFTHHQPQALYKAMKYAVFPGGKRLRPLLVLLSAQTAKRLNRDSLYCACAVELIHSYSLVHDDLPAMDNDDFRRGKPTVHRKFSEYIAILCGNALLVKAFELLSKIDKSKVKPVISNISQAIGVLGLVGGQLQDLELNKKATKLKPTQQTLLSISGKKTAFLFRVAAKIGAISATFNEKKIKALEEYGQNIGLAFQFIDDILDKEGFWLVLGEKKAESLVRDLIEKANEKLNMFGKRAKRLYLFSEWLLERIT